MSALILTSVLWMTGALGWTDHDHDHALPSEACCEVCGVETFRVAELIRRLQTCPRWQDRDNAAHALREFDWECHPEAARALAQALSCDPRRQVRVEAAQSLKAMNACLPDIHMALARAAARDPDWATRFWAKCGLKALNRKCRSACDLCGNSSGEVLVLPAPGALRPILPDDGGQAVPGPSLEAVPPPSEVPPALAPSPFLVPSANRRIGFRR